MMMIMMMEGNKDYKKDKNYRDNHGRNGRNGKESIAIDHY